MRMSARCAYMEAGITETEASRGNREVPRCSLPGIAQPGVIGCTGQDGRPRALQGDREARENETNN